MLKSRTILVLVLTIGLVMGMFSLGFAAQKQFLAIATGGTGGTYYPLGGALAQMLSNNIEDLIVTAQTGNASIANVNLLMRKQIETAFCQSNVAYWAYTATVLMKDKEPIKDLRGIACLYPETIHVIAQAGSGIDSIDDFRGKKVSVGAPNSGIVADVEIILEAHGMSFDDLAKADYLSMAETAQKFIDYQIDAYMMTTGYPSSSVINAATKRDIKLIPISDEMMDKVMEKSPYYSKTVIPAGIYKGMEKDVPTLATPCWWLCYKDLDPDLVYKMTKALWEHRDVLEKVHSQGKNVTLETALDGQPVPLHPGAERYYKEIGLIK